ncbi:MAG: UDP-N-acetylglucosamine--N-acetylmuramyl-(pentapeptide) pyrophosphoryl-undecaprenol N-acetylglucosamine transferase [Parcubacteria group bacterium]|nr:UDP-N-acetylglucosamine--N-acetylmuramyl-(pentapeptide) pyrophosphoryl-undecaprenol N-acetylglucosamine transferase [Parcubacteria group bacterium]
MNREIRIVLTGGGTGGHVFPLLAVAQELWEFARVRSLPLAVYYVGPLEGPFSPPRELFLQYGVIPRPIRAGSFGGEGIGGIFNVFLGVFQALLQVFLIMPDAIFSKGGYGALPVVLVRAIYRIPLFIHESDAVPGKVNLFARKAATRIAVSFPKSLSYFPQEKTAFVGNPVRKEFLTSTSDREEALKFFNLDPGLKTLLILGGSQGAKPLNEITLDVLPSILERYQVIHQCGLRNYNEVFQESKVVLKNLPEELRSRYKLFGFLNIQDLILAYRIADFVLARAGSGLIFEIAAMNKPSLLVPLAVSSRNHQRENAYAYGESGGAVIIEEENLKPHILLNEIEKLFLQPEKLAKMSQAAKTFAKLDAAKTIARELLLISGVNIN